MTSPYPPSPDADAAAAWRPTTLHAIRESSGSIGDDESSEFRPRPPRKASHGPHHRRTSSLLAAQGDDGEGSLAIQKELQHQQSPTTQACEPRLDDFGSVKDADWLGHVGHGNCSREGSSGSNASTLASASELESPSTPADASPVFFPTSVLGSTLKAEPETVGTAQTQTPFKLKRMSAPVPLVRPPSSTPAATAPALPSRSFDDLSSPVSAPDSPVSTPSRTWNNTYLSRSSSMITPSRRQPVTGLQQSPSSASSFPGLPSPAKQPSGDGTKEEGSEKRQKVKMQRSSTLPTFPPHPSVMDEREERGRKLREKVAQLPSNPKAWTPSQVALYLTAVLNLVPQPIIDDVTRFVRSSVMGGRTFLRLREEDLVDHGLNSKWRKLMMDAVRRLRKDCLQGRLWGFGGGEWQPRRSGPDANDGVEGDVLPETTGESEGERRSEAKSRVQADKERRVRRMVHAIERAEVHGAAGVDVREREDEVIVSFGPIYGDGFVRRRAMSFSASENESESEAGSQVGTPRRRHRRADSESGGGHASDVSSLCESDLLGFGDDDYSSASASDALTDDDGDDDAALSTSHTRSESLDSSLADVTIGEEPSMLPHGQIDLLDYRGGAGIRLGRHGRHASNSSSSSSADFDPFGPQPSYNVIADFHSSVVEKEEVGEEDRFGTARRRRKNATNASAGSQEAGAAAAAETAAEADDEAHTTLKAREPPRPSASSIFNAPPERVVAGIGNGELSAQKISSRSREAVEENWESVIMERPEAESLDLYGTLRGSGVVSNNNSKSPSLLESRAQDKKGGSVGTMGKRKGGGGLAAASRSVGPSFAASKEVEVELNPDRPFGTISKGSLRHMREGRRKAVLAVFEHLDKRQAESAEEEKREREARLRRVREEEEKERMEVTAEEDALVKETETESGDVAGKSGGGEEEGGRSERGEEGGGKDEEQDEEQEAIAALASALGNSSSPSSSVRLRRSLGRKDTSSPSPDLSDMTLVSRSRLMALQARMREIETRLADMEAAAERREAMRREHDRNAVGAHEEEEKREKVRLEKEAVEVAAEARQIVVSEKKTGSLRMRRTKADSATQTEPSASSTTATDVRVDTAAKVDAADWDAESADTDSMLESLGFGFGVPRLRDMPFYLAGVGLGVGLLVCEILISRAASLARH